MGRPIMAATRMAHARDISRSQRGPLRPLVEGALRRIVRQEAPAGVPPNPPGLRRVLLGRAPRQKVPDAGRRPRSCHGCATVERVALGSPAVTARPLLSGDVRTFETGRSVRVTVGLADVQTPEGASASRPPPSASTV